MKDPFSLEATRPRDNKKILKYQDELLTLVISLKD